MSPPFVSPSHPPPSHPSGHQRVLSWAPCVLQQLPPGCLFYSNLYISMLFSQFVPSSLSPTVSISLFSMSASLFLPCKWIHQYHFSNFMLLYDSCFSLPDFLPSNRLYVRPPVICCQNSGVKPGTEHLASLRTSWIQWWAVSSNCRRLVSAILALDCCLASLWPLTLTYVYFIVYLLPPHFHFDSLAWSHLHKALIFDY